MRLANIYMSADVGNNGAAVTVLNKATQVDANNPDVYLKLGTAQNALGNTEAALLAWQRYLELAPNDDMATVVREKVEELSKKPTTTTTSTATSGSTATTAAGSSTTATTTP